MIVIIRKHDLCQVSFFFKNIELAFSQVQEIHKKPTTQITPEIIPDNFSTVWNNL